MLLNFSILNGELGEGERVHQGRIGSCSINIKKDQLLLLKSPWIQINSKQ